LGFISGHTLKHIVAGYWQEWFVGVKQAGFELNAKQVHQFSVICFSIKQKQIPPLRSE